MLTITTPKKIRKNFISTALKNQGENFKFLAEPMHTTQKHLQEIDGKKVNPTDAELLDMAMLLGISVRELLGQSYNRVMLGVDTKDMIFLSPKVASNAEHVDCILSDFAIVSFSNGEKAYLPVSRHIIQKMYEHIEAQEAFCEAYGNNKYVYLNPKYINNIWTEDEDNYDYSPPGCEISEYCSLLNPALDDVARVLHANIHDLDDKLISDLVYGDVKEYCSKSVFEYWQAYMKAYGYDDIYDYFEDTNVIRVLYGDGTKQTIEYDWIDSQSNGISQDLCQIVQMEDTEEQPTILSIEDAGLSSEYLGKAIINLDRVAMISFPIELGEQEMDSSWEYDDEPKEEKKEEKINKQ